MNGKKATKQAQQKEALSTKGFGLEINIYINFLYAQNKAL